MPQPDNGCLTVLGLFGSRQNGQRYNQVVHGGKADTAVGVFHHHYGQYCHWSDTVSPRPLFLQAF